MAFLFARAGIAEMSPADAWEFGIGLLLVGSIPVVLWFIFAITVWGSLFRRSIERRKIGLTRWLVLGVILVPGLAWGCIFSFIIRGRSAALIFLCVAFFAARRGKYLFERYIMQGVYRCPECETLLRQDNDIHHCPGCGGSWIRSPKGSEWKMVSKPTTPKDTSYGLD